MGTLQRNKFEVVLLHLLPADYMILSLNPNRDFRL